MYFSLKTDMENSEELDIKLDKDNLVIKISRSGKKVDIPILITTKSCAETCPISRICALDEFDICNTIGDRVRAYNWIIDIPTKDGYRFRRTIATLLEKRGGILKKKISFKRNGKQ